MRRNGSSLVRASGARLATISPEKEAERILGELLIAGLAFTVAGLLGMAILAALRR